MSLGKRSTAKDVIDAFKPDLKGKTAVVTGGNSGIGTETVKALASAGCRVILCSRSVKAGEEAVEMHVKKADDKVKGGDYAVPDADVKVMQLDLADLRNVEQFAKELQSEKSIDYLVLNAGVMIGPKGAYKGRLREADWDKSLWALSPHQSPTSADEAPRHSQQGGCRIIQCSPHGQNRPQRPSL